MVPIDIGLIAGGASVVALAASATTYYFQNRNYREMNERVDGLNHKLNQIEVLENRVFSEAAESEEFEKSISELSERLFHLIKRKYDLESVTTYKEMSEALEDLETNDDKTKEHLQELFDYLMKLEYADRDLSNQEKAVVRQLAYSLIRTAGPDLEIPEQGK